MPLRGVRRAARSGEPCMTLHGVPRGRAARLEQPCTTVHGVRRVARTGVPCMKLVVSRGVAPPALRSRA